MVQQVATTKQTSGAGFDFEDKVAASYAIWMLQGGFPFIPSYFGSIIKMEFQKRVDKYYLDDLVLTLEYNSESRQCSFSVKSNIQFGKNTAPSKFVQALWEMFLHERTERFVHGHDLLGLVTAPLPNPPKKALLQDLLPKARRQEPGALTERLLSNDPDSKNYASSDIRTLFNSFSCPEPLAKKYKVDKMQTAELLKHVLVLEFDFENDPSNDEACEVLLLQNLLVDGTPENAWNLWLVLLEIVRRENKVGGYLDREKLLNELRGRFNFKQFPDYESDWKRLVGWGREIVNAIPDTIGGKVPLPRTEIINEIIDRLMCNKICSIIGASGVGKTVVSKLVANSVGNDIPILWFDADEFVSTNFEEIFTRLQLQHNLSDLLTYLPNRFGVIVIDGLERLSSDKEYIRLNRIMSAIRGGQPTSSWVIILSCQTDRWEYAQTQLIRIGIDPEVLSIYELSSLSPNELQIIYSNFPNLYYILFNPNLSEILRRPKVLDILATHSELMKRNSSTWAGESHLIDWYWESIISAPNDGPVRGLFLQQLAERQADKLLQT
jgi:hypothetical protein